MQIGIDLETFSPENIQRAGLYRYALHPEFDILLCGFSINGGDAVVLDCTTNEGRAELLKMAPILWDAAYTKTAFNAAFEWFCLSVYLNRYGLRKEILPIEQWQDTQLAAQYCGYPRKLELVGEAMGLPDDKKKKSIGKSLIRLFCVPRTPTKKDKRTRVYPSEEPEKWSLFKKYNAGDVVAEQEILRRLSKWPVPEAVQQQWQLDTMQNFRGVNVDLALVDGALKISADNTERLLQEAAEITHLENPNSRDQLHEWLTKELPDNDIPDLKKDTVSGLLGGVSDEGVRRVLEIRQETGKAAHKKYGAIRDMICADGRLRGLMMFYGANRTGRWASTGVQLQNLARTHIDDVDTARALVKSGDVDALGFCYGNISDTLGQLVRSALIPSPGNVFVDADFSAIEARVIAWLAGEEWVLEVFRTHGKIYEATASQMFGVPMEKIKKGNPEYELRQRGKVATLALGYQGGANALTTMDVAHVLTDDEKPGLVKKWREANPAIVKYWYDTERAAIETLETGLPHTVRYCTYDFESDSETNQWFLTCLLPSERKLFYVRPTICENRFGKRAIRYWGLGGGTKGAKKWCEIDTYGGRLVENQCQAVARDCLAEKLILLKQAGYPVAFSIHDEIVSDVSETFADLETVTRIMSLPISWAPGLPLNAEGWVGKYFRKD